MAAAINDDLTISIRTALAHLPHVREGKMFGGVTFMVNDKLCACNSGGELMLRFDPALTESLLQKPGVRPMIMRGKQLQGYAYINAEALKSRAEFDGWMKLALAYNPVAKSSKKKP